MMGRGRTGSSGSGAATEDRLIAAELNEARAQQAATAEILRVISTSRTSVKPVFDTIALNAARLCAARFCHVFRFDGELLHFVAHHRLDPRGVEAVQRTFPSAPTRGTTAGRSILSAAVEQIPDVRLDPEYSAVDTLGAETLIYRSLVAVPMMRDGLPIGTIVVARSQTGLFPERQVELLKTFADQAVIAIENARVLNELRESLQRQTATADVLKAISRSTFDLQTVLDTLTRSAAQLCEADMATIYRPKGDAYYWASSYGYSPEIADYMSTYPMKPGRGTAVARVLADGAAIHISDVLADPDYTNLEAQKLGGYRTLLAVPLLRDGTPIGVISLARQKVRPFTDKQIELVSTFADQAVIAIENARLLNELRESLQQQTATSEVLKTIGSSAFDLDAVLRTLVQSAIDLCHASLGHIFLREGELFTPAMQIGHSSEFDKHMQRHPIRPGRGTTTGRVVLTGSIVHVPDVLDDPEYTFTEAQKLGGFRTALGVPLIRDGKVAGVFTLARSRVEPFTQREIELVQTFSDQAVIAIENVRLFDEVQKRGEALAASVEEQKSLAAVSQVVNSSLDLEKVLATILSHACVFADSGGGSIYIYDTASDEFVLDATYGMDDELRTALGGFRVRMGETVLGQCAAERRPLQIADIEETDAGDMPTRDVLLAAGIRAILAVPLLRGEEVIGALVVRRRRPGEFPQAMVELLQTFAAQSALAIHNARLFNELAKSLEDLRTAQDRLVQTEKLASLGQLTAGIAHEIKNPLNFVNNFSSLSVELVDELGEALDGAELAPDKRATIAEIADTLRGNLDRVAEHGRRADAIVKNMLLHSRAGSSEHRLADINAIVEESLNLAYHGARAEKQGFNITMEKSLDPEAGEVDLYPQEITRVLLNLISNGFYAATKRKERADGSDYEPTLTASTKDLGDSIEIRIRDNGTGIPPEAKEKLFSPFFTTKPAGEGTGLGLSISHDIVVKQHAGTIEVESEPGAFTEFRIVLPRRAASLGEPGGQA
jgi:two-component system NtrC family sensor kinase